MRPKKDLYIHFFIDFFRSEFLPVSNNLSDGSHTYVWDWKKYNGINAYLEGSAYVLIAIASEILSVIYQL